MNQGQIRLDTVRRIVARGAASHRRTKRNKDIPKIISPAAPDRQSEAASSPGTRRGAAEISVLVCPVPPGAKDCSPAAAGRGRESIAPRLPPQERHSKRTVIQAGCAHRISSGRGGSGKSSICARLKSIMSGIFLYVAFVIPNDGSPDGFLQMPDWKPVQAGPPPC